MPWCAQAANYMNIKNLLDLTCLTVANMIKGARSICRFLFAETQWPRIASDSLAHPPCARITSAVRFCCAHPDRVRLLSLRLRFAQGSRRRRSARPSTSRTTSLLCASA